MVLKKHQQQQQKKDKDIPRKPMDTFVYKGKKRDRGKEVEAMTKDMEQLARETDVAIAQAGRSLEELRKVLSRA